MEIVRRESIEHVKPESIDGTEYLYASSAKIFEGNQLFLYSEKVEPGKQASKPHFHLDIDEIAYVISGNLVGIEGNEEVSLNAGDSICFYANSEKKHYLVNKSSEVAEFLLFRRSN